MMTAEFGAFGRWIGLLRVVGWSLAALLLLLPAVTMQFTDQVDWTAFDFVFAAILLGGTGLLFELIVRRSPNLAYLLAATAAVANCFFLFWTTGAVGVIGSEDHPANLVYIGVIFLALIGAIAAAFRPSGMARVMLACAAVSTAITAYGFTVDVRGATFSLGFVAIWLLSAALFRVAARAPAPGIAG